MTSKEIKEINELFEMNVLPLQFNFTEANVNNHKIDWEKVKYNSFYKTPEFYLQKFPNGIQNIPGIETLIQSFINQSLSPLEELEERNTISSDSCNATE